MRKTQLTASAVTATMKQALVAAALFAATTAQAAVLGFTGDFAPGNWTQVPGTGSVNSFSAASLSMSSGDDLSDTASNTDVTILLALGGIVSFDWDYSTSDLLGPVFDPFFSLEPAASQRTDDAGGLGQSGSRSFAANAGDTIGFRMRTLDNLEGSATVRISNFCFSTGPNDPCEATPNPAPEPGSLALLGLGLAGLGLSRRRKAA